MRKLFFTILFAFGLSLNAQVDAGQFTIDAVTAKLVASLHVQAEKHNSEAIKGYNLAVSNYNLNAPIRAALQLPVLPLPAVPLLQSVNDDQVAAMEADWLHADKYKIFSFTPYVPPPAPVVVAPVKVAGKPGAYQGNGVWGCRVGDTSPDGAHYENDFGAFIKHLVETPFGAGCSWTMIP